MTLLKGKTGEWEMVMGLEIHAQVMSKSKLFSGASTTFGSEANDNVSFVDAGFPGMLPVLNEFCVEQAVRTGIALGAEINLNSVFARKNYFYPDLPSGYQISQYDKPIVGNGKLTIDLPDGTTRDIGIERLHLEMDAGKSLHDQSPNKTYIDLNRSGVALMEIVSKPDLRTVEEVVAYLKKMRAVVRFIETSDGDMEKGNLRCDVNLSVRKPGEAFGTRCEIKNMNSFKFIGQAIEYEARRQIDIIESGGKIMQETRLFDPEKGETRSLRTKEDAQDYRYFPDPDLLPLNLDPAMVQRIRDEMPELPDAKKKRYMDELGLSAYDANILASDRDVAGYYDTVAKGREPKIAANWVIVELFGALNKDNKEIGDSPVSAENLGKMLDLMKDGTISGKIAKEVFAIMYETGNAPDKIVEEKGLKQVSDVGAIAAAVDKVLAANADKVAEYKSGKQALYGFFVGQVMKETGGKANPGVVNDLLKQKLAA